MGCLEGKGKKSLKGEKYGKGKIRNERTEGDEDNGPERENGPYEKKGLKWRRESPLLGNEGALMGRRVPASQYLGALFAN